MPTHEQTRRGERERRVSAALVTFALCVALGSAPGRAVAQAPPVDTPTVTSDAGSSAPERSSSPMVWVYLLSLVSAAGLVAVYAWRRASQRRYYEDGFAFVDSGPPPIVTIADVAPTRQPTTLREELGLTGALALRVPSETPLFTLRGDGPPKECPDCQREFASWMVVCPHDNATLRAPKLRARRSHKPGDRELARSRCPLCERRYSAETAYCPLDGEKLTPDTTAEAAAAQPLVICRACGKESSVESPSCCDAHDVVTVDPRDTHAVGGAVSLLVCHRCHTYGAFGSVTCPHDGEFLLPSSLLSPNVLPSTGWGVRRKMCQRCGSRFSEASYFCCDDGARLKSLD